MNYSVAAHTTVFGRWLSRGRFLAAVAIVWALLRLTVEVALADGPFRPLVLSGSVGGFFAAFLLLPVVWVAAALVRVLWGGASPGVPFVIVGLGLAFWGARPATIDQWLVLQNPVVGPPAGRAYWPLLIDYIFLAAGLAGVMLIEHAAASGARLRGVADIRSAIGSALTTMRNGGSNRGFPAMLTASAAAILLLNIFTGSIVSETLPGQIYFAVFAAFALGVLISRRIWNVNDIMCYWFSPVVVGLIACLVAALWPDLSIPVAYRHLNTFAAWGAVKPLPVQMVGVGMVAVGWMTSAAPTLVKPGAR